MKRALKRIVEWRSQVAADPTGEAMLSVATFAAGFVLMLVTFGLIFAQMPISQNQPPEWKLLALLGLFGMGFCLVLVGWIGGVVAMIRRVHRPAGRRLIESIRSWEPLFFLCAGVTIVLSTFVGALLDSTMSPSPNRGLVPGMPLSAQFGGMTLAISAMYGCFFLWIRRKPKSGVLKAKPDS